MPCASSWPGRARARRRPPRSRRGRRSCPGASPRATRVDQDRHVVAVRAGRTRGACRGCRSRRPRHAVGQLDRRRAGGRPRRRTRRRRRRCCRRRRPDRTLTIRPRRRLSGVVRRARSTGTGRAAVCRSAAGSSSSVTATCVEPSTSDSTACTVATPGQEHVLRVGAAAAAAQSRTRLPLATGTPSTSTESVSGSTDASAAGSHQGASRAIASAAGASGDDLRSPAAGSGSVPCSRSSSSGGMASTGRGSRAPGRRWPAPARFSSSVSVIVRSVRISSISVPSNSAPRALRRDRRVVVEDDRRAEHRVGALAPDQHRPGARR